MIALVAALLLANGAPGASLSQPPAAGESDIQRAGNLQKLGFSQTAIGIILKEINEERTLMISSAPELNASAGAAVQLFNAKTFDAAAFERLLRAHKTTEDRLNGTLVDKRMAVLRALPPADQALYARGLVLVRRPAGQGAAPAK